MTDDIFNNFHNSNVLKNIRNSVVQEAINRKILKEEEIEQYVGKYIDEFGIDSFVNYLTFLFQPKNFRESVFLTLNHKMLRDRILLEKRFGIKIASPDTVWDRMGEDLWRHF